MKPIRASTHIRNQLSYWEDTLEYIIDTQLSVVTIVGFDKLYKDLQGTFFVHPSYGTDNLILCGIELKNDKRQLTFDGREENVTLNIEDLTLEDKLTLLEKIENVI